MYQFGKHRNPAASWVLAFFFAFGAFLSAPHVGPSVAHVAAQNESQAANGICEMRKETKAFFVYFENEDKEGYDTSLPVHEPWAIEADMADVVVQGEYYHGPGQPTLNVVADPLPDGETPRTVRAYGSKWFGEADCKHNDVMTLARNYVPRRDQRGNSGWLVDLSTGTVTEVVPNPDERIFKVAREDVPAWLATFNNADTANGERNLFDGVKLKWADTGKAITLPESGEGTSGSSDIVLTVNGSVSTSSVSVSTGGGSAAPQSNPAKCPVTQPIPGNDLESGPGVAPLRPDTDGYIMVDTWGRQWDPNLSPQKKPGATAKELQFGEYFMMIRPEFKRWDDLHGLNGAVYIWPAGCEAEAVRDYNSKDPVRRITVTGYLKWVADGTWPEAGAKAKVSNAA